MKQAIAFTAALLFLMPLAASAQDGGDVHELRLEARGGVTFQVPAWKQAKHDDAVAVLERAPDTEAETPFGMLVLAVEEGPGSTEDVDWARIRDNIVEAAGEAGTELNLELRGAWTGADGFSGQHLAGTLTADEREVAVDVVALVAPGILVTVSAIGPKEGGDSTEVAEQVAGTASRPNER